MSPQNKKHILLIGPPNSGKTTLFNWLTGFKHKTVNYPGSTVSLSEGHLLNKYNLPAKVTDSPGIYSLSPSSQDERITKDFLFKNDKPLPVILVLDASKLEIQLPLFFQLKETGCPLVLALSMWDLVPNTSLDLQKLESLLSVPVIPIKGNLGEGVELLIKKLKTLVEVKTSPLKKVKEWNQEKLESALNQSKQIIQNILIQKESKKPNLFFSQKLDRIFLHPKKGLFLFAGIMFGLFSSIFWLATPFMNVIDLSFAFLIDKTNQTLSSFPYLADFLSQGLLASFGSVLVFVPQIFILFVGISLLEDSGYLARAVALMDGPLSRIGLSGRAFVPFLAGYACAIPAIMAVRNLKSEREKLLSFLAIPFMSCSARIPVYALLLSFLFYGQSAWKPALALSLIYIASFFLGAGAVALLNLFLKKESKDLFLLDLPLYRKPLLKKVLQNAGHRTQHYIVKAGPAIFTVALFVWALSHLPFQPELSPAEKLNQSYLAQIGQGLDPLWASLGIDWRVGVALLAAFAAREVFVSTLLLMFTVTKMGGEALSSSLLNSMETAIHPDGTFIFTTASVTALIVFFMFSLQCLSTTVIVYKESGSLKLALTQLLSFNVLAYLMALLVYQSLNWLL